MQGEIAKLLVLGLLSMLGTVAINRGAVAYHDGLRTRVPELRNGESTRRQLAAYAYSISIGFIVAYALPYSLATGIIVIHIILLAADVIGVRVASVSVAGGLGFVYGVVATWVIDLFVLWIKHLPLIVPNLQLMWLPLGYSFPLLAAVAAAQVFGVSRGVIAALFTLAVWKVADLVMHGSWTGQMTFTGGSVALFVTSAIVIAAAYRRTTPPAFDIETYDPQIARVRRNWLFMVPAAALIALAASQSWLAGEPIQLVMLTLHQPHTAALVALFSTVGFVPMMAMTGLVSGVWNQDGYPDWILGIGYAVGNPIAAVLGGAIVIGIELVSLRRVGYILSTHPGIHDMGAAMRDAMDIVPTISILAGAVWAALTVAGPAGALVVVGAVALNDLKGRPIIPMAMPVFAYLAVGVVVGVVRQTGVV